MVIGGIAGGADCIAGTCQTVEGTDLAYVSQVAAVQPGRTLGRHYASVGRSEEETD